MGKGGVGKTICSCSLAVQLSYVRENVLIVSTYPTHSISEIFCQNFYDIPIKVQGFENLYAMEIDLNQGLINFRDAYFEGESNFWRANRGPLQDFFEAVPGIDEAMCYITVMKYVQRCNFSVVVFDTPPTGQSLRFLKFPFIVEDGLSKLLRHNSTTDPFLSQVSGILGLTPTNTDLFSKELENMLANVKQIKEKLVDSNLTAFVCVSTAEFLSLYEMDQLFGELVKFQIVPKNIIVNQLLLDSAQTSSGEPCNFCDAVKKNQTKFLEKIVSGCGSVGIHVTRLPLLDNDLYGVDGIKKFSENLMKPNKIN